ncbi:MAG: hypothetical protein NT013_22410, partial [Planctomycetia bacterium]|nr:hypothetical protein [Planctomycetia bacterium]
MLLWAFGTVYWLWQPDALAMLHLCPRWAWWLAGVTTVGLAYERPRWRVILVIGSVWCVTGVALVEESRSLARGMISPTPTRIRGHQDHVRLRIATLNCGSGGALSVRDALIWSPDILLLQESPSRSELEELVPRPRNNLPLDLECGLLDFCGAGDAPVRWAEPSYGLRLCRFAGVG